MLASGRYSHLNRTVGHRQPGGPNLYARRGGGSTPAVSIHVQTVLFMMVAVLVGGGLFTIVPRLSAASNGRGTAVGDARIEAEEAIGPADIEAPETKIVAPVVPVENGISPVFTPEVQHWAPKIVEWSAQHSLDPDIVATIMQIESCGDPGATSHAGAQGLFQVMPFHFDPGEDMLDPDTNARRGMAFYNRQLEYTGNDVYLSFAGYNGGYAASGTSYSYWANETQRYFNWAKGIYDEAKAGMLESPTLRQWLAAGGGGGCQRAAQRLGI